MVNAMITQADGHAEREATNEHMTVLGNNPERVMGYFQDCRVRYAA